MSKYLIEVYHGDEKIDCLHSVEIFLKTGNHFLVNADWGCLDGQHKAWFFIDVNSKDDALKIIPPAYRNQTKITQLNKFNLEAVEEMLKQHHA